MDQNIGYGFCRSVGIQDRGFDSQPETLELHFSQLVPVGSQNLYLSETLIYLTLKNRIRIFLQISFGDVVFETATLLLRFLLFKTLNHSPSSFRIKKSIGISKKVTLTRNNVDVSNSSFLTQRCKSMRCNLTVTVLDCPMS